MTKLLTRIVLILAFVGLASRAVGMGTPSVVRAAGSSIYEFRPAGLAFGSYINTPHVQGDLAVFQNTNAAGSCCYQTGVAYTAIPAQYEQVGTTLQWGLLACSPTTGTLPVPLSIGVENGHPPQNTLSERGQLNVSGQFAWQTTSPVTVDATEPYAYFYVPGSLGQTIFVRDLVLGDPASVSQYIASHSSEASGGCTPPPCGTATIDNTFVSDCTAPLTVGASNITVDLGGHKVLCSGGNGIVVNGETGVQVKNGEVSGCNVGLQFSGNGSATAQSGNQFTNLRLDNNSFGAYGIDTYGNAFSDDTIVANRNEGVRLAGFSAHNSFDSMTIQNNASGLAIDLLASYNTLTSSDLSNNQNFGLYVCCYHYTYSGTTSSATGNIIKNVTIDNTQAGSGYGYAAILAGEGNTLTDSIIDGSYARGIVLVGHGQDIERNTVSNTSGTGIFVEALNVSVLGNTVSAAGADGISVAAGYSGNTISGNRSTGNIGYDLAEYASTNCSGNTWGSPSLNYAAKVLDGCETGDTTGPVITPHVTGAQGSNGWYTGDVSVSWDVADPETPVTAQTGCGPSSVTSDTAGQTFTCTAASPGGTTSRSITIKRDASAPDAITATPSRAPDHNGWYNAPFSVQWSGNEDTSTPLRCDSASYPGTTSAADTATGSLLGNCTNDAGLAGAPVTFTFQYDGTVPTIAPYLSPAASSTGWYNIATGAPSVSFTCSAGISGLDPATPCPGAHAFGEGANQSFISGTISSTAGLISQPGMVSGINVDLTAPTITISATTADGKPYTGGWTNHAVTVSFACEDGTSGVQSNTNPSTLVNADGIQTVTDICTDKAGNSSTASYQVQLDTAAPICSVSMSPSSIWPPNKTMVAVTATVETSDGLSGVAGFVLKSLTTNEGDISAESSGWTIGQPSTSGKLLADRDGNGTGRLYTFTYLVTDRAGNSSTCTGKVTVPHDQGK